MPGKLNTQQLEQASLGSSEHACILISYSSCPDGKDPEHNMRKSGGERMVVARELLCDTMR